MGLYNFSFRESLSRDERTPRTVVFLLLPHVHLLDLSGPAQVFDAAYRAGVTYTLRYCSSQPTCVSAQGLTLTDLVPLPVLTADDLVIIPGIEHQSAIHNEILLDQETRDWLVDTARGGTHMASICTGAFVLGEAGLLNGRSCTTHWAYLENLRALYPETRVLDNMLFVEDRTLTTSAGVASGIDLALAFLEREQGPLFAAQIARYLVLYLRRNGFQAQESIYLEYRTHVHSGVHRVQDYLINHIAENVLVDELANIAGVSARELNRAFKEATGLTPVQYHQRLRMELATTLLPNRSLSIEEIAFKCGFEDVRHFRRLWQRHFEMSPSASRARVLAS